MQTVEIIHQLYSIKLLKPLAQPNELIDITG